MVPLAAAYPLIAPIVTRLGIAGTKAFLRSPAGKSLLTKIMDTAVGSGAVAYGAERLGLDHLIDKIIIDTPEGKVFTPDKPEEQTLEEWKKQQESFPGGESLPETDQESFPIPSIENMTGPLITYPVEDETPQESFPIQDEEQFPSILTMADASEATQKYFERSEYVKKNIAKGKEIDEAIAKIDPDLIENMTGKDLQIYLKDNFNLDVTERAMYRKIRKKKIPVRSNIDWNIGSKVKEALEEIGDKDYFGTITKEELWAKPQIQKIAKEGFLTPETLSEFRIKMKYPIKQKLVNYFDKFGADHDTVIKYITENNPTTPQLIKKFPKLQKAIDEGKVKQFNISQWRLRNDLS